MKYAQFRQKSWRHWSQWLKIGTREVCCDCGMVHKVQYAYKISEKRGYMPVMTVYKRVKVHHAASRARRKVKQHKCR